MKVTEFQKAIGVNSNSYGRFMGYKGAYQGSDNGTYLAAFHFFRKREQKGIKVPKKKVKKDDADQALDVSNIVLEGEAENAVPVYDSCEYVLFSYQNGISRRNWELDERSREQALVQSSS
jgi:hypothetical protein